MYNLIRLIAGVWTVVAEFPDWETANRALSAARLDGPDVCLVLAS
jgi:hypothetical protein